MVDGNFGELTPWPNINIDVREPVRTSINPPAFCGEYGNFYQQCPT
jgi:hypothetical protein